MESLPILYFFIGALACSVGALPLGLVNLSIVEVAIKKDLQHAMGIAKGASLVEIAFALTSLMAGAWVSRFFDESLLIKWIVFSVLLGFGILFWVKKNVPHHSSGKPRFNGFFKGVLLNLASIQVFLFWLVVASILAAKHNLPLSFPEIFLFVAGVLLAKIAVLRLYAYLAVKIIARTNALATNINRIIGALLVFVALIQLMKI